MRDEGYWNLHRSSRLSRLKRARPLCNFSQPKQHPPGKTMLVRLTVMAMLVFAPNAVAGEPWDKQPPQWTLAEAYQILTDSPWSPAKSRMEVSWVHRRVDWQTLRPSDSPAAPSDPGLILHTEVGRGKRLPAVSVLWWSAKTLRLAQQRMRQLRDPMAQQTLHAERLKNLVLVVEGTEALGIFRDAEENLRETVFLELPNGVTLDIAEIEFHEGEKAGEDFTAFHFPRERDGRATVGPGTERVIFHCKATGKTARPGRPNALSIRATFEPRKMSAAGQPDL